MEIGFQMSREAAKKLFFDRPAVKKMMDRKTLVYLRNAGGFIRLVARRSIRKATRKHQVSAPGSPPLSHTDLLKQNIFFGLEPSNQSVVAGPVPIHNRRSGTRDVPRILEEGGTATVESSVDVTRRRRDQTGRRTRRRVRIAARPYMGPALEKATTAEQTRKFWEEAARKA